MLLRWLNEITSSDMAHSQSTISCFSTALAGMKMPTGLRQLTVFTLGLIIDPKRLDVELWKSCFSSWEHHSFSIFPYHQGWYYSVSRKCNNLNLNTYSPHYVLGSVASVMSNSLQCYGLYPTSFLSLWDFPGKNTGIGCQGIFPTQGLNSHLLHCREILYCWATKEAPLYAIYSLIWVPFLPLLFSISPHPQTTQLFLCISDSLNQAALG